jgi:ATP-dependent Clp protease ATP-binding subunit ClpB
MDIQSYPPRGRSVVQSAQTEAVTRDPQQLVPLHILAALLLEDGDLPKNLLQMAGADVSGLESRTEAALEKLPKVEGGSGLSLSTAAAKTFANAEKSAKKAGDAFVTVERL